MSEFQPVSDEDLRRAREDAHFRHKLLARNLERLLSEMNRLRSAETAVDAARAVQIREGAQLAVKLADLIRATAERLDTPAMDVA